MLLARNTTRPDPHLVPTRVSAYEQGRRARLQGLGVHESPPFKEMYNQQQWQEGWTFQDEVERIRRGD